MVPQTQIAEFHRIRGLVSGSVFKLGKPTRGMETSMAAVERRYFQNITSARAFPLSVCAGLMRVHLCTAFPMTYRMAQMQILYVS